MKKSKKKYFEEQLARLNEAQRRLLYKRAANLRKAEQVKARTNRKEHRRAFKTAKDHDMLPNFLRHAKAQKLTLDDWALRVIEEEGLGFIFEAADKTCQQDEYTDTRSGTVISAGAKSCVVLSDDREYECLLGPELFMSQKSDLAVGDQVDFAFAKDGTAIIWAVDTRKSKLSRPDPTRFGVERVIAANIDVAVIVASIRQPQLRPSLVDRYLIAAQKGGIEPVVCLNKIDLLEGDETAAAELAVLKVYEDLGLRVFKCCAVSGTGVDELIDYLKGKLCVFVGHSGTGKSSLLNSICPEIDAQVGRVHAQTGLGRHTTTASTLFEAGEGVRIIDTPGIREFGLWAMAADDLKWYFDEFDEFAEQCRYSNCSHTHEPDCAVKAAVDDNSIPQIRYESYLRILESLESGQ